MASRKWLKFRFRLRTADTNILADENRVNRKIQAAGAISGDYELGPCMRNHFRRVGQWDKNTLKPFLMSTIIPVVINMRRLPDFVTGGKKAFNNLK
jgi:hypothetical protein